MISSREQDTSREQQSRDLISETIESVAEEHDATQRHVLRGIVSAQGAARRDRRFQAEHAEHEKTRMQCKGCSACDRQSGKTRRKDEVTRHSIRSPYTIEGSQTARRRYLQLWLTKHITAFQKNEQTQEAAYHDKYKSQRHCERFEIQQVAVRETDTVKPERQSVRDGLGQRRHGYGKQVSTVLSRCEPRRWNRDELAFSADDERAPKDPHTQGPCSDRCLRDATQGRCESVLARSTPGPVMRRQGESAMSADRSIILRCGNGRVVSADQETPGQERSSSCPTRSNRRRLISRCREGWRQRTEPHREGMCG